MIHIRAMCLIFTIRTVVSTITPFTSCYTIIILVTSFTRLKAILVWVIPGDSNSIRDAFWFERRIGRDLSNPNWFWVKRGNFWPKFLVNKRFLSWFFGQILSSSQNFSSSPSSQSFTLLHCKYLSIHFPELQRNESNSEQPQYSSCSSLLSSQSITPSQNLSIETQVLPSEQHRSFFGQLHAPGSRINSLSSTAPLSGY